VGKRRRIGHSRNDPAHCAGLVFGRRGAYLDEPQTLVGFLRYCRRQERHILISPVARRDSSSGHHWKVVLNSLPTDFDGQWDLCEGAYKPSTAPFSNVRAETGRIAVEQFGGRK